MTRSSDEALDEAQLALGTKCERLLSSAAWHKAHTSTQKGLLRRLQMLKAAGLPAMRLVSNSKLKALGRSGSPRLRCIERLRLFDPPLLRRSRRRGVPERAKRP